MYGDLVTKCDRLWPLQVRKLEFLIADVRRRGHDCVITIGGIQSNHCRCRTSRCLSF